MRGTMSEYGNTNQSAGSAIQIQRTRSRISVQNPMSGSASSGGSTPTPTSYIARVRPASGTSSTAFRPKSIPSRSVPPSSFTDDHTTTRIRYSTTQLPSPPNTIHHSSELEASQPRTPQRRHLRHGARYPDSLARVPLHRRRTATKYETMEDLLTEAGYKETRVFTPEMERLEAEAEERKEREKNQSGVIQYLSGLISRTTSRAEPEPSNNHISTGSPTSPTTLDSPSTYVRQRQRPAKTTPPLSRAMSTLNPSAASLPTHLVYSQSQNPNNNSLEHLSESDQRRHRPFPRNWRSQTYSEAAPAKAYLRHMSSAPAMKRSNTALSRQQLYTRQYGSVRQRENREGETDTGLYSTQPPLPRNWITKVTQAILFGSVANIMEPRYADSPPSTPSRALTLSTDSSGILSVSTLMQSPYSFRSRGRQRCRRSAPGLINLSKSRTTQGNVTETHVFVRSAPASRTGSLARADRELSGYVQKNKGKGSSARRQIRTTLTELPVLARTTTENDIWEESMPPISDRNSVDEEDDEEEIDLARLLVPSKRAQSIMSLRKHLPNHSSRPR